MLDHTHNKAIHRPGRANTHIHPATAKRDPQETKAKRLTPTENPGTQGIYRCMRKGREKKRNEQLQPPWASYPVKLREGKKNQKHQAIPVRPVRFITIILASPNLNASPWRRKKPKKKKTSLPYTTSLPIFKVILSMAPLEFPPQPIQKTAIPTIPATPAPCSQPSKYGPRWAVFALALKMSDGA